jgi:hypothetical protein
MEPFGGRLYLPFMAHSRFPLRSLLACLALAGCSNEGEGNPTATLDGSADASRIDGGDASAPKPDATAEAGPSPGDPCKPNETCLAIVSPSGAIMRSRCKRRFEASVVREPSKELHVFCEHEAGAGAEFAFYEFALHFPNPTVAKYGASDLNASSSEGAKVTLLARDAAQTLEMSVGAGNQSMPFEVDLMEWNEAAGTFRAKVDTRFANAGKSITVSGELVGKVTK